MSSTGVKRWGLPVAVAVALVAVALALRGGRSPLPPTPQQAVNALFDAAAKGDDQAYLGLLGGELRDRLEETRSQLGREAFCRDIERSAAGVKSLAIAGGGDASSGTVELEVEIVYADRVVRQQMVLTHQRNGWLITAMGPATEVQPPVPYGTPAF